MIQIEEMAIDSLIPYAGNARKHDDKNVADIAASISEYGFNDPIAINEVDSILIEGHGRLLAARKLGLETVPVIKLGHMSPAQIKGYTLIHNRLAEKSEWDKEILQVELSKLSEMDIDLDEIGFADNDLDGLGLDIGSGGEDDEENAYTNKITGPIYEPKGDKPPLTDLCDDEKTKSLIDKINESDLSDDEKDFLKQAARRHLVFRYDKVAEYYAHSNKAMQELMEQSALVIIDFDKAIEEGFVKLSESLSEAYLNEEQ